MDNAQKAIMIGVGLFITIIIISVVLLITNIGTGMVDEARNSIGNMNSSMQQQVKTQYDDKDVSGSDIVSLWNQYSEDESFLIVFKSMAPATGTVKYYYNAVLPSGKGQLAAVIGTKYYELANSGTIVPEAVPAGVSATNKINPRQEYHTYLIKVGDDVVGVYAGY